MARKKITPAIFDYPTRIRLKELGPLVDRYAAEATGGNRSEAVRTALKAFLLDRRVIDPKGLIHELARLHSDFLRVGNNFNQIARAYNMDESLAPEEVRKTFTALRFEFRELQNLFEAVADELRKTA